MQITGQKRSRCSLNFALEAFGDIWSLLIVRDILLFGKTTYGEFLSSEEKIATNILADRLEKLMRNGILEKKPCVSDKRKDIYELTQRGIDLYPVMREMMLWSAKYDPNTNLSQELINTLQNESQQKAREKFQQVVSHK